MLHDAACEACSAYSNQLAAMSGDITEWDGRSIHVRNADHETVGVIIADQWGEIAVVELAGPAHAFMPPEEVITWLRYLAMKCPECEGEAL